MTVLQALVLGVVEGITEFLPVSSTGHLILAERLMGIPRTPAADAYAICIQGGAIVAVLGLYRDHVRAMLLGLVGREAAGRRLLVNVAVAFVPAAVLGVLFDDAIEAVLFGLWPVVVAWVVGGGVILALGGRTAGGGVGLDGISPRIALGIGFAQCLALWPGTSRSLATILGGVLLGANLAAAVEFSFLLGVLTLGAATAYAGLKHAGDLLAAFGPAEMLVGFASAAISAALAVRWLVGWLQRHGLRLFAVWRIGLGLAVAGALLAGLLPGG
jgi:undecaprenyl-diphosphatase